MARAQTPGTPVRYARGTGHPMRVRGRAVIAGEPVLVAHRGGDALVDTTIPGSTSLGDRMSPSAARASVLPVGALVAAGAQHVGIVTVGAPDDGVASVELGYPIDGCVLAPAYVLPSAGATAGALLVVTAQSVDGVLVGCFAAAADYPGVAVAYGRLETAATASDGTGPGVLCLRVVELIPRGAANGSGGSGVPTGGTVGQLLIKQSSTDGDAAWGDADEAVGGGFVADEGDWSNVALYDVGAFVSHSGTIWILGSGGATAGQEPGVAGDWRRLLPPEPVAVTMTVPTTSTGVQWIGHVPVTMTIASWEMVADVSGSCVLDVWAETGAIPDNADSITAAAPPTLSAAQLASSSTLTGWTTTLTAGDVLAVNVDSATTVSYVTLTLRGVRA